MRAFDSILSGALIILASPVLLLAAIAIRLDTGGPVFFRQLRVGLNGTPFNILKFRTMIVDAERHGGQLSRRGDARVTRVGRVLRRSKVDELAQLFNVFAGDMALVGPRPEVPRYVALYDERQREVLKVRPGITDPSSIVFRNEGDLLASSSDPETLYVRVLLPRKIDLSLTYVRQRSLGLDLLVLLRTAQCLVLPDAAARGMLRTMGLDPASVLDVRAGYGQRSS